MEDLIYPVNISSVGFPLSSPNIDAHSHSLGWDQKGVSNEERERSAAQEPFPLYGTFHCCPLWARQGYKR